VTRFKLDENLPSRAAVLMRGSGHDVSTALEQGLGGSSDATIAKACADEGRVLVTLDLHFADIRTYGSAESPGIVVLRPGQQGVNTICGLLVQSLPALAAVDLRGSIAIVEPERLRTWRRGD
jgi:predicted nuclease of predicted toxin-antitoxin system